MIGNFKITSDADIAAILATPKRIEKYLYGEEFSEDQPKRGLLKLFTKTTKESDSWEPEFEGEEIDVDKAWHGIHFLLCGKPWEGAEPLNFVVCGGKEVGDVDVGYGPARAFNSAQVKNINTALQSLSDEKIKGKCDPAQFKENEIYPEIWDETDEECFGYILSYLDDLKTFISKASGSDKGLIAYIN